MSDPFSRLIPDARAFLAELAADNSRDWFAAQKPRYEAALKAPAKRLLNEMALQLPGAGAPPLAVKLFRPQRDLRFSRDKTPYHTHLHMMWSVSGAPGPARPALFLGIAPEYVRLGGGVMGFDKAGLARWRAAVDGDAEIADILAHLATRDLRLDPPALKRVPAPHAPDHPRGDLLRHKGLTLWRDLPPAQHGTPCAALSACFADLQPLLLRLQTIAGV